MQTPCAPCTWRIFTRFPLRISTSTWAGRSRSSRRALFDKIVTRRRGGFCYELNGLLCGLLRELGFRVTMLSAEVARAVRRL